MLRTVILALALGAAVAAQPPDAASSRITYIDGQLTIDVRDAALPEVLAKVAALTGVKITLPEDAVPGERMPTVQLGPGPARQVLAALLADSDFDFLLQASNANPDQLRSVLLIAREKKSGRGNAVEAAARAPRSPFARAAQRQAAAADGAEPESESAISFVPVAAQPEPPAVEPQPEPPTAAAAAIAPEALRTQPAQPGTLRPGAMSPPPVLTPQSMSQQLLQMYQQRAQMTQQARVAAAGANTGGK